MGNFDKKLKQFSKTLKSAKERSAEDGFGAELPDSVYKAQVIQCDLGESKSSGRLQVTMGFKVLSGDYEGECVYKYQSVEDEDSQVWLNRDLRRFGADAPETSEELLEILKVIDDTKPEVKISLKTKDSGQFCYINQVLEDLDFGDLANQEEPDDEDNNDGEDGEIEEGSIVTFEDEEGDEVEGTVKTIMEDENEATVETEDGDEYDVDLDALTLKEEEEPDEPEPEKSGEDTEVEVGMKVSFEGKKGKTLKGKVTKLLEDEGKVKVKVGDKKYTVDLEDLSLEEEEPEKPKVKRKVAKKIVKKVAKKKVSKKRK